MAPEEQKEAVTEEGDTPDAAATAAAASLESILIQMIQDYQGQLRSAARQVCVIARTRVISCGPARTCATAQHATLFHSHACSLPSPIHSTPHAPTRRPQPILRRRTRLLASRRHRARVRTLRRQEPPSPASRPRARPADPCPAAMDKQRAPRQEAWTGEAAPHRSYSRGQCRRDCRRRVRRASLCVTACRSV